MELWKYILKKQKKLKIYIQKILKETIIISLEEISSIVKNFFYPTEASIKVENEESILTQFKNFLDYNLKQNSTSSLDYDLRFIELDVKNIKRQQWKTGKNVDIGNNNIREKLNTLYCTLDRT
jgi:hypothetical protein